MATSVTISKVCVDKAEMIWKPVVVYDMKICCAYTSYDTKSTVVPVSPLACQIGYPSIIEIVVDD